MHSCLGLQPFLFGIKDVEEEEGSALFGKTKRETGKLQNQRKKKSVTVVLKSDLKKRKG